MSHGRGGAGNITSGVQRQSTGPLDLSTPTIKSPTYTTGRGGTGNMAHNDPRHPEFARASQDVDHAPVVLPLKKSATAGSGSAAAANSFHVGRGGEGNIVSKAREGEAHHGSLLGSLMGKGKGKEGETKK